MQHGFRQGSSRGEGYLPIEDYGIIGDLHTVALVGKNGSIDWACIPSFDAPSVFGALLDAAKGGFPDRTTGYTCYGSKTVLSPRN